MKIKNWLNQFFHFNKQERNGVFVLCLIIFVLFTVRLLLPLLNKDPHTVQFITLSEKPDQTETDFEPTEIRQKNADAVAEELFVFNPNTIAEEDLPKLGFSKKLSATLVHYRNKGGRFFKPEDLKKLYGLSPRLYSELKPYILIPEKNYKKDSVSEKNSQSRSYPAYETKTAARPLLDINSADSLSLVFLKGIGPGFTKRILKYRNMLGGFHSPEQLKSVYGMTDSLYQVLIPQITVNAVSLVKIPVNSIDFNSLRKHPYVTYQLAQAIINFRTKHGKLTEKDIIDLGILSGDKLNLLLPYLRY